MPERSAADGVALRTRPALALCSGLWSRGGRCPSQIVESAAESDEALVGKLLGAKQKDEMLQKRIMDGLGPGIIEPSQIDVLDFGAGSDAGGNDVDAGVDANHG